MDVVPTIASQITWPCIAQMRTDRRSLRDCGPVVTGWFGKPSNSSNIDVNDAQCFLIDTGARSIGIDAGLASALKLNLVRSRRVHGASGQHSINEYLATLYLPTVDASGRQGLFRAPVEVAAINSLATAHTQTKILRADGQPAQVVGVLGRIFLQYCEMSYDGRVGEITLKVFEEAVKGNRNS
jgi:hypothetical protein